jgi:hypothetical protein
MEDLLVEVLAALFEIVGEFLLQVIFELAVEALASLINFKGQSGPIASAIALMLGGGTAGFLSILLFPHRLIAARTAFPGISLLLAPLATGYAMQLFGGWLRSTGRYTSSLATFRGGFLFAFAMASIRWWFIGLQQQ